MDKIEQLINGVALNAQMHLPQRVRDSIGIALREMAAYSYRDAAKTLRDKAEKLRKPPTDSRNRDLAEIYEGSAGLLLRKASLYQEGKPL